MDVFLFPSLYEGLPLSIIEAQAAGLPCIISDSVPSECRVTDLAESLDLNLPIDEWADVVLEKQSTIRKNTIDDIKNQVLMLNRMSAFWNHFITDLINNVGE